jgi:large subunit ribosomal protein L10
MPNSKNLQTVQELNEKIKKSKSILFSDFKGVKTKDLTSFREEIKEKGGEVLVSKNTLLKIALKENKFEDNVDESLAGQTVAVLSYQDPLATIKSFFNFAQKIENLKAKSGFFENKFVSEKELNALSKLPSKEELIGKLIGSMKSPIFGLVNTLGQTRSRAVYVFKAIADKKQ